MARSAALAEALPWGDLVALEAHEYGGALAPFVGEAWRFVDPSPFVGGWHLDAIAEHLQAVSEGEIRDLLITMPPRHGKSTMVSVIWPAWEWARRPHTRFLTASYALPLAIRDAVKSRRLIASPWYQEHWPVALADDENMKSRYSNDRGGYRIAASVGSTVTGEGGDVLVIDDPHNAIDAQSQANRETVREWWGGSWSTRANDPKRVRRVVVQQRLHEQDLAGVLLEQGGWVHLNLPAEYESSRRCVTTYAGKTWSDPRTEEGELLCPDRFGPSEVARLKRELGSYHAAGQLQQRPSPPEGGMLRRSWWRRVPRSQYPERFDEVLTTWDLAVKGGAGNDQTAGFALGRVGSTVYGLGAVVGRMEFVSQIKAVEDMARRHPGAVLIEDAANASALQSSLAGRIPGLLMVRADRSKDARVATWAPWLEAGNMVLPEGEPWADALIEEAATFPRGAHDDQVDAWGQGAIRLLSGSGTLDFGIDVA